MNHREALCCFFASHSSLKHVYSPLFNFGCDLIVAVWIVAESGLACHLGVLSGLPCVGVAKNLLQVQGVNKSEEHQSQVRKHHLFFKFKIFFVLNVDSVGLMSQCVHFVMLRSPVIQHCCIHCGFQCYKKAISK